MKGFVNTSQDREQELAITLSVTREALFALLTPEELRTRRKKGSAEPHTFEDSAREISESDDPRADETGAALKAFQAAVNTMWTYALEARIPEMLVVAWRRKHKGYGWIGNDEVGAEAVMALRHFIVRFSPRQGTLVSYAYRGVHQYLTEWAAQQGCVEVPQKVARVRGPDLFEEGFCRDGLEPHEHLDIPVDYESVINEALDKGREESR